MDEGRVVRIIRDLEKGDHEIARLRLSRMTIRELAVLWEIAVDLQRMTHEEIDRQWYDVAMARKVALDGVEAELEARS